MSDEMREDGHLPATKVELFAVRDELSVRLDDHDRRFDGIDASLRRLSIGFAKMDGDVTVLKVNVGALLENFAKFSTTLERTSGNVETALRKMDMQGSMLMEHEGRIAKLESRPS